VPATVSAGCAVPPTVSAVQEKSNYNCHCCWGREDHLNCIVELKRNQNNFIKKYESLDKLIGERLSYKIKCKSIIRTQVPPVWTGPRPETKRYSLKYCGTERPKKREKPRMNFVLKLFRLQNWRSPRPAEAAYPTVLQQLEVDLNGFLEERLAAKQRSISNSKSCYKTNWFFLSLIFKNMYKYIDSQHVPLMKIPSYSECNHWVVMQAW